MAQEGENIQANGSNNGQHENNSKDLLYSQFQNWLQNKEKTHQAPSAAKKSILKLSYPKKLTNGSSNKMEGEGKHKDPADSIVASDQKNSTQQANKEESLSKKTEAYREVSESVPPSKVHGFEKEVLSLEKFLLKQGSSTDQLKAIAIVGVAGVGKTTLCQEIFNHEKVKKHFLPRIWVCMFKEVTEYNDPKVAKVAIVKRILEGLGVEGEIIKNDKLDKLLYALHLQLWGKRYLIVLDDARESDGWCERLDSKVSYGKNWGEDLSYGFPKGYGGRVIFTSRNEELANKLVGEENLHRLLPLSDPDSCWSIYMDAIKGNRADFDFPSSEAQRKVLQKKCGGLPLAAKMTGKIKSETTTDSPAVRAESILSIRI